MAIKDDTAQGSPPQQPVQNGGPTGVMSLQNVAIKEVPPIADPAPLGLAAFALMMVLLSAKNATWTHGTDAWLGFAFAYGGLAQLLAGMWEFRNRNVFGATAFSTYGGFWIGLGLYVGCLAAPHAKNEVAAFNDDLGWILLAFAIFNSYMLLWSKSDQQGSVRGVLDTEVTEIVLFIGFFNNNTDTIKAGGVIGVITAATVLGYASAAGVINNMKSRDPYCRSASPSPLATKSASVTTQADIALDGVVAP